VCPLLEERGQMYLKNALEHLMVCDEMVQHVTGLYAFGRQQLTVASFPAIQDLLAIEGDITQRLAKWEQQMVGDLDAARRAVA
jgi:hypothetical protein